MPSILDTPPRVRPKHLNLMQIRLPVPGWVSIMHRASGVFLFLSLPLVLWLLDRSLYTERGYSWVVSLFAQGWVKLLLFAGIWAFFHHFCAGIRYLLLDCHIGVRLPAARAGAIAVYIVSIPLSLAVAYWLLV